MNLDELRQKITEGKSELSLEEKSYLLRLMEKPYGLHWEDKPEAVEEMLATQLPVLHEVPDKFILANQTLQQEGTLNFDADKNPVAAPNHLLIEGDNLHALAVLNYTHTEKVDVVYIDPPYNTGNKDFMYNDRYVDKEDSYRHSKWLSFMEKRLRLARNLLKETGVIFISIDDNEQANLKLLCDDIFGEENFVAKISWQKVYSPRMDSKGFSSEVEYLICYAKSNEFQVNQIKKNQETKQFNKLDTKTGKYYRRRQWRKEGSNSKRSDRPNLYYSINAPDNTLIYPIKPNKSEGRWRGNLIYFEDLKKNDLIEFIKDKQNKWQIYVKQFLEEDAKRPPTNLWMNDDVGNTHEAAVEIKSIFGMSAFSTPKPTKLVNRILEIGGNESSLILDFFAGSGTTLHATMQLNEEDGGNRTCILVTNNENKICEEVTYERNKRVIQGYTNNKNQWVSGLKNNNLRYYRTGFVETNMAHPSRKQRLELVRKATDMLRIKEDTYFKELQDAEMGIFYNTEKYMLVIYDDEFIERAVDFIQGVDKPVNVYVFSDDQYTFEEDFEEVADKVTLCALPEAIYKAYKQLIEKFV